MLIKVLSTEQNINSANTVSNAKCVRLIETGTGNALITRKDGSGNTIGTFTVRQGTSEFAVKDPTDTLTSGATSILACSVAFQN